MTEALAVLAVANLILAAFNWRTYAVTDSVTALMVTVFGFLCAAFCGIAAVFA